MRFLQISPLYSVYPKVDVEEEIEDQVEMHNVCSVEIQENQRMKTLYQ